MRISIFGLGYVGTVTAGCLAVSGHDVTGVDISQVKIDHVNASRSPIYESGMEKLIADAVDSGRLKATFDARSALLESDVSIITVGTPSKDDGSLDSTYLNRVCTKLGQVFANKDGFHTFVIRSTVLPGMTEELIVPLIENASGKKVFLDFDICYNPYFLRVGSLVEDFNDPPYTLIGQQDDRAGDRVAKLYGDTSAPVVRTSIKTAEMMKYACDVYHASKVCFANEVGAICKKLGVDSHEMMNLLRLDERLNVSGAYLEPGFSYGGPSIPKSIRILLNDSGLSKDDLPMFTSFSQSNEAHLQRALEMVLQTGAKRIGIVGLAFKPGTDELRESQMVKLAASLIDRDLDVMIFDEGVSPANLMDANKEYVESRLPNIAELMAGSFDQLFNFADVLVLGHKLDSLEYLASFDTDKIIIDLVRISEDISDCGGNYEGLCW